MRTAEQAAPLALAGNDSQNVAAVQVQAHELVETQLRYTLARSNPRNLEEVRQRILEECELPEFAEEAKYSLSFGGGEEVEGLTIRFAEAVMRATRNVEVEAVMISDSESTPTRPGLRTWRCAMKDFEYLRAWSVSFNVEKTVERRNAAGRYCYGSRLNRDGREVFIVSATESELAAKEGAAISKAQRNLILKWVDPSIKRAAENAIARTNERKCAENPIAARRQLIDGFKRVGVTVAELELLTQQPIDTLSPAQLAELRALWVGLRDGVITWRQVRDDAGLEEPKREETEEQKPSATSVLSKASAIVARLNEQKARTAVSPKLADVSTPLDVEATPVPAPKPTAKSRDALVSEIIRTRKESQSFRESFDAAVQSSGKTLRDLSGAELESLLSKFSPERADQ